MASEVDPSPEPRAPRIPYLDTSALVKWYLAEPLSDEVERYLVALPFARISPLTVVELRCLLARRRRAGELTVEQELECRALFEEDVGQGSLHVISFRDSWFLAALRLMDQLPNHPLRTLDALHLAILRESRCDVLATADRVMAEAARALGIECEAFVEASRD